MTFAERNGFESTKAIQLDDIDQKLRNRLYNLFCQALNTIPYRFKLEIFSYIVDQLGYIVSEQNEEIITARFLNQPIGECKWYDPYTIIELLLQWCYRKFNCKNCPFGTCPDPACTNSEFMTYFPIAVNGILEQEKSGYRLIDNIFLPITDKNEISSLQEASKTPYASVNKHIQKALKLYSDRDSPDYENSIKESISAVEALCCIITGVTGSQAALGAALKKLEEAGVCIHSAMKSAFSKLYGYTSDADGIRHGGIDFTNAPSEDAKYMMISCSAFINYLIEKYSKTHGLTNG